MTLVTFCHTHTLNKDPSEVDQIVQLFLQINSGPEAAACFSERRPLCSIVPNEEGVYAAAVAAPNASC